MTRVACFLALVAAAFVLGGSGGQRDFAKAESASAQVDEARPHWLPGRTLVYRLRLASRLQPASAPPLVDFVLTGDLELSGMSDGSSPELRAVLSEPTFEARAGGDKASYAALAKELAEPCFLQPDTRSKTSVHRATPGSAFLASIWQTLASALSFTPSAGPSGSIDTWTAEARDGTGRYAVEYRKGPEPGVFKRRKLRYEELNSVAILAPGRTDLTPQVRASDWEIRILHGRLNAILGSEELVIKTGPSPTLISNTSLHLELVREAPQAVEPSWVAARQTARPVGETAHREAALNTDLDEARIGGQSYDAIVKALEEQAKAAGAKPRGAPDEPEQQSADLRVSSSQLVALAALFRKEPALIGKAAERILKKSPARQALLDGLGAAGTPEAQSRLLEIVRNRKNPLELRRGAALSLIRTFHATEQTVLALIKLQRDPDVGLFATYGLGTIARRLRGEGREETSNLASRALLEALERAKGDAVVHALRGIANSGYSPALDRVRPLLESPDPLWRGAAVEAIRLMTHPDVDVLITARLRDGDQSVRLAALNALKTRTPNDALISALKSVAKTDSAVPCRDKAARVAGSWREQRPELASLLRDVSTADSSPAVRATALRELDQSRAKP